MKWRQVQYQNGEDLRKRLRSFSEKILEKGMKWNGLLSKAKVHNTHHKLFWTAALERIRWLM